MVAPPSADFDTAVRLTIMDGFLAGEARPSVASVAGALGADEAAVAGAFDRLAAGRAIVLEPGSRAICMVAPFSGVPTDFRTRVGEHTYFANCVWDAVGIPAMLAAAGRPADAVVETRCPDCAAPLRLDVAAGRRVRAEPPGVVAHFAVPAARWWADIVFT